MPREKPLQARSDSKVLAGCVSLLPVALAAKDAEMIEGTLEIRKPLGSTGDVFKHSRCPRGTGQDLAD